MLALLQKNRRKPNKTAESKIKQNKTKWDKMERNKTMLHAL